MVRKYLLAGVAALLPVAVSAQGSFSVKAGTEVKIAEYVGHTSSCKGRETIITVTAPPSIGTLEVRKARVAVPNTAGIGTVENKCVGKKLPGVVLIYKAPAGASGYDRLTYERQYKGIDGKRAQTVNISLQ